MKKLMLLTMYLISFNTFSQDSLSNKGLTKPKRNEVGINVLPPILILSSVTRSQPKFFNATYRYLYSETNALRITGGINVFNSSNLAKQSVAVSISNSITVYKNTTVSNPVNTMLGIGYERIIGKRKLKHVVGCDLTYNYVKENTAINYHAIKDTIINSYKQENFMPIDTGKTNYQRYFSKFGITPFYSLRFALTPKLLVTASTRLSLQTYTIKNDRYPNMRVFDFNSDGLISEISLFYRF